MTIGEERAAQNSPLKILEGFASRATYRRARIATVAVAVLA